MKSSSLTEGHNLGAEALHKDLIASRLCAARTAAWSQSRSAEIWEAASRAEVLQISVECAEHPYQTQQLQKGVSNQHQYDIAARGRGLGASSAVRRKLLNLVHLGITVFTKYDSKHTIHVTFPSCLERSSLALCNACVQNPHFYAPQNCHQNRGVDHTRRGR